MSLPSERSDEPAARRPTVDYFASQRAAAGDRFNWSIEAPRSDDLQGRISSSHVFPNAFPHGAECATEEREPGRASGHLLSITRAARYFITDTQEGLPLSSTKQTFNDKRLALPLLHSPSNMHTLLSRLAPPGSLVPHWSVGESATYAGIPPPSF